MSVVFVPERLRGKAEVNQETLQRVSGRRDPWGGGTGAPGTARAAPALPGLAAAFATPLSGGAGGGAEAGGDGGVCRSCWRRTTS